MSNKKLPAEMLEQMKQKAEDLETLFKCDGGVRYLSYAKGYRHGYELGATEYATQLHEVRQGIEELNDKLEIERETIKKAIDLLAEAATQIEYLHNKFKETGSGNNVLSRIKTFLDGK